MLAAVDWLPACLMEAVSGTPAPMLLPLPLQPQACAPVRALTRPSARSPPTLLPPLSVSTLASSHPRKCWLGPGTRTLKALLSSPDVSDHLLHTVQHLLFNAPRTSVCGALATCKPTVQMPVASTWAIASTWACPSLLHAQASLSEYGTLTGWPAGSAPEPAGAATQPLQWMHGTESGLS